MTKEAFKKFLLKDNLIIISVGVLITLVLIGFLVFGLSDPSSTFVKTSDSLVELQNGYESEFIEKYNQGSFTKNNPMFILDPYHISPLSGLLIFDTEESISFKLVVKGKTLEADIEYISYRATKHRIPVYSLYPDYNNTIELYEIGPNLEEQLIATITARTDKLPSEILLPSVIETSYEYFGDNLMMLMPAMQSLPVAYDFNGDVRWYLSTNMSWAPIMLENGHLLLGTNKLISSPYYTTGLYEIDYLGKIHSEFKIPGGYHHDVFEMPSGNLLIGTSDFNGTVEDVIVEMDRITGEIIKTWDIADYIPEVDGMSKMWTIYDWFHNNSVFYDETTDSIILSGRHQDAVISIGYSSNELNWIIGDPTNWSDEVVAQYFFTPIGNDFEWQYAQHSAIVLENGNIFMFDNGNNRSKLRESDIDAVDNYSRGVIYEIDTTLMTIDQVYQFGKELGYEFYSPYISNVAYYDSQNYMIHSGGYGEYESIPLNIPAPLSENIEDVILNSITIEVLNNEIAYRLEVADNFYRAMRIELYDDVLPVRFGTANIIGELNSTEETDDVIDTRFNFFDSVPGKYEITLEKDNDRLELKGIFKKNESIYISLENSLEEHIYKINLSNNTFTAMCIAIFEEEDSHITYYINEENIRGIYHIYLYIDGHKYNTYEKVVFK